MRSDAHFLIGQAHINAGKSCQDYATAGISADGGAYAIVSDGCSSGGETDVGARVLALATAQAIVANWDIVGQPSEWPSNRILIRHQLAGMAGAKGLLGLTDQDMLATCATAFLSSAHGEIILQGDGAVAWRETSGKLCMVRIDWADNTPCYPIYASNSYADFVAHHGGDRQAAKLTHTYGEYQNGHFTQISEQALALGTYLEGMCYHFDPATVDCLAVFTDGVTQVDGMEWFEVVHRLLLFKTTAGSFAKRRLARVAKDSLKVGRGPIDDIAYAVILRGENDEDQPSNEG